MIQAPQMPCHGGGTRNMAGAHQPPEARTWVLPQMRQDRALAGVQCGHATSRFWRLAQRAQDQRRTCSRVWLGVTLLFPLLLNKNPVSEAACRAVMLLPLRRLSAHQGLNRRGLSVFRHMSHGGL